MDRVVEAVICNFGDEETEVMMLRELETRFPTSCQTFDIKKKLFIRASAVDARG